MRASLATNNEWIQRYFAKILPWMSGQQNSVLSVLPGVLTSNSSEKGVYQLQSINFSNDQRQLLLKEPQSFSIFKSNVNGFLIGAFETLHGSLNNTVLLWKHSSLTTATKLIADQLKGRAFICHKN